MDERSTAKRRQLYQSLAPGRWTSCRLERCDLGDGERIFSEATELRKLVKALKPHKSPPGQLSRQLSLLIKQENGARRTNDCKIFARGDYFASYVTFLITVIPAQISQQIWKKNSIAIKFERRAKNAAIYDPILPVRPCITTYSPVKSCIMYSVEGIFLKKSNDGKMKYRKTLERLKFYSGDFS